MKQFFYAGLFGLGISFAACAWAAGFILMSLNFQSVGSAAYLLVSIAAFGVLVQAIK